MRRAQQLTHQGVALGVGAGVAALLHLGQAMVQGLDQQGAALGVVQQIVLQIRVALHHPDIAQHLVQHAGGAAGAALLAQLVQQLPGPGPEQADHDLPVGEGGVVVGNLAQTRCVMAGGELGNGSREIGGGHRLMRCVHVGRALGAPSVGWRPPSEASGELVSAGKSG